MLGEVGDVPVHPRVNCSAPPFHNGQRPRSVSALHRRSARSYGLHGTSESAVVLGVDATAALADHRHRLARLTPNPGAYLAEILPACRAPLLQRPAILPVIKRELGIDRVERLDLNLGHLDDTDGCARTLGYNRVAADLGRLLADVLQVPEQAARRRLDPRIGKLSDATGGLLVSKLPDRIVIERRWGKIATGGKVGLPERLNLRRKSHEFLCS